MTLPWEPYDRDAAALAEQYESLSFEVIHAALLGCLPASPGVVLDVGAGSGRDAAWFAGQGFEVVAVEPSAAMRAEAARRHAQPAIRWIADALPELASVSRSGMSCDFVLLAGVWMHVAPEDRPRAFAKLAALLAPGGRLAFTLRQGPTPPGRVFHPVSAEELDALALSHHLARILRADDDDALGRPGVRWSTVVFHRA